jgi:hypothetical protein
MDVIEITCLETWASRVRCGLSRSLMVLARLAPRPTQAVTFFIMGYSTAKTTDCAVASQSQVADF